MGKVTWRVLDRLFDDEPPLRVWREERGLELSYLTFRTGIAAARLDMLDADLRSVTDAELDRLTAALRIPYEFLAAAG